jgi:hypothetical protein
MRTYSDSTDITTTILKTKAGVVWFNYYEGGLKIEQTTG